MNGQATELTPSQIRKQRYRKAIVSDPGQDIPKTIAHEFPQGDFGVEEVILAQAQITRFLAEAFCGDNPVDTEIKGVGMGAFWITNWLVESQEKLADLEGARSELRREASK